MFNQDQQQPSASLRRETTDEISKMYTTLYDNEDPRQQLEYAQLQQQQLHQSQDFIHALVSPVAAWNEFSLQQDLYSPASPALSCFSGSSSPFSTDSGSTHSSPAAGLLRMIEADEADELVDMFNITIEDLLSGNPLSPQDPQDFSNQATLFSNLPQDQHIMAALDFENELIKQEQPEYFQMQYQQQLMQHQQQQRQYYQSLHNQCHSTRGGPQRSGSLSPVMPSSPYHRAHPSRNARCTPDGAQSYPESPEQNFHDSMPSSPLTTYYSGSAAVSPSLPSTSCMSPTPATSMVNIVSPDATAASESTAAHTLATSASSATLTNLPGTEGMTVIRSEDGSIMVYNSATESMSFRCELCPGETYGRIHDLKRHQASKHQDKSWPCEFCQRPFVRRDALLRHFTVKAARNDGLHPASHETEKLMAARARAKNIC
ncbi:hypothetical protein KVV02_001973 [Mortierella alpina]|uniref:C2H2-type domain-containing protein n=1 Tax=Mortierella alpina TaxID=64518 RepID=A0A9P8A0S8_MORAP|nr:hypothetical protein KVV02_001973 [Mortierella alpina]